MFFEELKQRFRHDGNLTAGYSAVKRQIPGVMRPRRYSFDRIIDCLILHNRIEIMTGQRKIMRIAIALGALFYVLPGFCPAFGDEPLTRITAPLSLSYDATYTGYKFAEIDLTESNPYEYEGNKYQADDNA